MKIFIFIFMNIFSDVNVLRRVSTKYKHKRDRELFLGKDNYLEKQYQNKREVNSIRMVMKNVERENNMRELEQNLN